VSSAEQPHGAEGQRDGRRRVASQAVREIASGWEMSLRAPGTEAEAVVDVVEADGGDRDHAST
jgi:hypothetical protein